MNNIKELENEAKKIAIKSSPKYKLQQCLKHEKKEIIEHYIKAYKIKKSTNYDITLKRIVDVASTEESLTQFYKTLTSETSTYLEKLIKEEITLKLEDILINHRVLHDQGIVYLYYFQNEFTLVLPEEFKKTFTALNNSEIKKIQEQYNTYRKYILGYVNAYGGISIKEFKEKHEIENEFYDTLKYIANTEMQFIYYKNYVLNNAFEGSEKEYIENLKQINEIPKYEYPIEEIIKFSDTTYYQETEEIKNLKTLLKQTLNEIEIEQFIQELLEYCNMHFNENDAKDFIKQYKLKIAPKELMKINETSRLWRYNGNKKTEIE